MCGEPPASLRAAGALFGDPFSEVLPQSTYGTCAVVGSSYTLQGSQLGATIDSHDQVFRINWAPIEGFEEDVGYGKITDFFFF